jgi:hypothetical protein
MYLREKTKDPNKKLDILKMKGKHKGKIIKKVEKDSEATVINTAEQKNDTSDIVVPNNQPITLIQKM